MRRTLFIAVILSSLMVPTSAFAAAKTYQVTGPIIALTDTVITIEKGKDKWEIDRNSDTKIDGQLKVGEKVTVYYTMTATKIESKSEKK